MYSSLQRLPQEELERRQQAFFNTMQNPAKNNGSGLQRRESMIAKGFNALFRRDSMLGGKKRPEQFLNKNMDYLPNKGPDNLINRRPDHFLNYGGPPPVFLNGNNNGLLMAKGKKRIGRTMSFKHPERISQLPPAEVTRIRSKSQYSINEYGMTSNSGSNRSKRSNSAGSIEKELDFPLNNGFLNDKEFVPPPVAAQWIAREKFAVKRRESYIPPRMNYGGNNFRGNFRRSMAAFPPPVLARKGFHRFSQGFYEDYYDNDER